MTSTITSHTELADSLARWRNFQECLLVEARFTHHTYDFELVFDYTWGDDPEDWTVRPDLDTAPKPVTLRLIGVEEVRFVGGLNSSMRTRPDLVNWGLSEVAMVRAVDRGDLVGVSVSWEGERRIEAACVSMEFIHP